MIGDDDDRDVPAAVVRPERLEQRHVAVARPDEVNEDDFRKGLSCPTQRVGRILGHGDAIALAFEAATVRVTRLRLVVDQESGGTWGGVDAEPPFSFSTGSAGSREETPACGYSRYNTPEL